MEALTFLIAGLIIGGTFGYLKGRDYGVEVGYVEGLQDGYDICEKDTI